MSNSVADLETEACVPRRVESKKFNPNAILPHSLKIKHVQSAMVEWIDFLGFINGQLATRGLDRLESFMMPANFSSLVGEFVVSRIPTFCTQLVKNRYHNGHPDLVPKGHYPEDKVLHGDVGIEVKASRHNSGWQGHNAEACWLMIFVFRANAAADVMKSIKPMRFSFRAVYGAQLTKDDWQFSGRSETSRRTITASVKRSGLVKLTKNWIYRTE